MREQGYMLPKSYRKIGLGFFILAILAFASVFYLIWAKVTIIITPGTEKISQELFFDIREASVIPSLDRDDIVPGKVKLVIIEEDSSFAASGSKVMASNVVGEVTIINNYSKEQTLVETTRLAAPDNPDQVSVRLKRTVTVPAGEKLKVQVYPENPDDFKDIEPMKFIIPGLWGPLQDKIYAQNSETLSKADYIIFFVTQEDLDQAEKDLKDQLYQKALAQVNEQLGPEETLWPKLVSAKIIESSHDVEAGEETAEFTTTMKLEAAIVVFDESKLISLAREKLTGGISSDQPLVDLDPKNFSYLVESYSFENNEATIKVSLEGDFIIANAPELLDKSQLVGLTEEEIKSYFSQFEGIESVEVKFQPNWLKKTPRFKEKIEIEIAK